MASSLRRFRRILLFAAAASTVAASAAPSANTRLDPAPIPAYHARFARTRPVIAVVGENAGTELTDFAIPYGVLRRSGVAAVFAVATQPGVLRMRPALKVQPDFTVAEFDRRFPDGADYVLVPAVVQFRDPTLLAWVKAQAEKGGTIMSICDGAAVVAGTGVMDGHRATAHWASAKNRRRLFPRVNWIEDVRYVSDDHLISTAGISAALPASLGLVEAIGGRDRAATLAQELGVDDWDTTHQTAPFRPRLGVNLQALIAVTYTNGWFHRTEMLGLPVAAGVDEIALAFMADAYSRTGRSMVHAVANSPDLIRTRSGLGVIPDVRNGPHRLTRELPGLDATPSGRWLEKSLDGIYQRYGRNTAYGVALNFEYAVIPSCPLAKTREVSLK